MCKEEIYINMNISFLVSKFLIFVCGIQVNYHELKSNIIIIDRYDLQLEKTISEIRKNDNIHELAVEA